ncbi:GntR family transcriptional regulator [Pseudonocardia spinosispora]|uniref:GntR family transcriptional regulator n=1 Tax=Pseudonocardia spinosispora TaxID=103441 RepID=UPI0004293497|nr:GntR family transcriptional regulator [Pseudonocardia spinosispora]
MPSIERAEPPYLQVVRHIREEIRSGRLTEGDVVPSARQIAAEWNVALATAAKALTTLRTEGLVRGIAGVGTVVAFDSLYHSARDRSLAVHRTGKVYPPGHYALIRSAELAIAPDDVAVALGVESGSPVIRRQRTTYDGNDTPLSTSISWFDGALASSCPDLLLSERIKQGTSGYIETQTGRAVAAGYDQLAAGAASADDAAELRIDPGSPVLLNQNRWVDSQGRVIEYGEAVSPQDRWAFYEYTIRSEAK